MISTNIAIFDRHWLLRKQRDDNDMPEIYSHLLMLLIIISHIYCPVII